MGKQNYIVINGNKYDAVTGKLIVNGSDTRPTVQTITPTHQSQTQKTGVVDGFVRAPRNKPSVNRQPASNAIKKPQRSSTLARKAVSKPEAVKANKQPEKPGIHKARLGTSPRRELTAKEVPKSPHINKFGSDIARSSVVKRHIAPPVKQAPDERVQHASPHTQSPHNPNHEKAVHKSVHQKAAKELIEAALANANSHNQQAPAVKKSRKSRVSRKLGVSSKAFALSATVLAFVLLAGFYAVQNVPNLSMRVAASRAGFDARMPGYTPSGFSFRGPINYEPGEVAVKYHANSDDREYSLIQRSSNWNSDALLANFIEPEDKQYQTYLDRGRTLYIYDESSATWIDDGIWYQIEGDSDMTTDQLVRIASSI